MTLFDVISLVVTRGHSWSLVRTFRPYLSLMETKVPDFVSTMSRTIKCNHCSKLLFRRAEKGIILYGLKVKNIKLYCIHRCFNTQNYIYPFQNLSLGFILKIFLKFRYSYKIYSYIKKECEANFEDIVLLTKAAQNYSTEVQFVIDSCRFCDGWRRKGRKRGVDLASGDSLEKFARGDIVDIYRVTPL